MSLPDTLESGGLLGLVHTHATTLPDVSVGHVLGQMVIALIVIVGGLWAVGKLYVRKRNGRMLTRGSQSSDGLRIISRQSLGKDQQLAVVMWGERKILIGISGSNISFFNDGVVDDATIASAIADPPEPKEQSSFVVDYGFGSHQSVGSLLAPMNDPSTRRKSIIEKLRDATQRN